MTTGERPVIVFFEVEPWERAVLTAALGEAEVRFFERPLHDEDLAGLETATILSPFIYSALTAERLARLPALQLVATRSTGFDHIDLAAGAQRGVTVCNVPTYGENTVAEHTFGLILALSRRIHEAAQRTRRGDFSLQGLLGFDLRGKVFGCVGAGSIGLHAIRIAKGFGMDVVAYDVHHNRLIAEVLGFRYADLDDLLAVADIISLHAPYNPSTHHLINRERLARVKPGAILINTARGGLVDTDALLVALDEGRLAGAGLDVVEGEELVREEQRLLGTAGTEEQLRSLVRSHILLRRDNVVFTPHLAFYSREALQRIIDTTIGNIRAFLAGAPQNVVRPR